MDGRRRLIVDDDEPKSVVAELQKHRGGPTIGGAAGHKYQIAFVPREGNPFNGGDLLSVEYHELRKIVAKRDFTELRLVFVDCVIRLEGGNLEPLFHRIRHHFEDWVAEADPMQALAEPLEGRVSGLWMEPLDRER